MLLTALTQFALVAAPQAIGGPWTTSLEITAPTADSGFGEAIAAVPDLDGDGRADFLVGAWSEIGTSAAHLYSSQSGGLIRSHFSTGGNDHYGREVCALEDLDSDGVADYAVGAQWAAVGGITNVGSVFVYSGATGAQLFRIDGSFQSDYFGTSISAIGDLNNDGKPDLIIGAYGRDPDGAVFACSGADGAVLYEIVAPLDGGWFGQAVASAGDINSDGIEDLMIGAPTSDVNSVDRNGMVEFYSGADGSFLRRLVGEGALHYFGHDVARIADLDGDGFPEHLIGAWRANMAYLYSGKDGVLMQRFDNHDSSLFGDHVGDAGDVDGDGFTDLLINGSWELGDGAAWVLSGATSAILSRVSADPGFTDLGAAAVGVGDQNGDGRADILVADESNGSQSVGRVRLMHSLNPYLTVSPQSLSISNGGSVHWEIDFPASEAGRSYQLFPSPVWGVIHSRTLDTAYGLGDSRVLREVITGAPIHGMTGRSGTLDAAGDATADMVLPAGGYSAFIGETMYWIAVVIPIPRHPTMTSSAVGVKLLP